MGKGEGKARLRLSATDMVTLYGVSPYAGASPHAVYLAHVHPEAREDSNEPPPLHQQLGTAIEPTALAHLSREKRVAVRRSATRTCKKHPWLRARPDALVVEGEPGDPIRMIKKPALAATGARRSKAKSVCEVKFISDLRMARLWIDARPRPPLYVHVQAQVEMTVCKLPRACGIGIVMGNPYIWELEHEQALEDEIIAIGENFLKTHIEPQVPPEWDGSVAANRLLMARWPHPDATFRRADLHSNKLAIDYLDLEKQIKALEKQQTICEQQLKEIIGDRIGLLGDAFKATWKAPRVGNVSWKDVAMDISKGDVPEALIDAHRSEPTRRFRVFDRDAKVSAANLAASGFTLEEWQTAMDAAEV